MRRLTMGLWFGVLATLGAGSVLAEPAAAVNRPIVLKAAQLFDSVSGTSLSDPVDNPQLTQEVMNAIVSEAHNWGRKVAAHCHGDKAAKMAIAAGVDSIERGTFLKDDTLLEMKFVMKEGVIYVGAPSAH